jgi:hypothetical protein
MLSNFQPNWSYYCYVCSILPTNVAIEPIDLGSTS